MALLLNSPTVLGLQFSVGRRFGRTTLVITVFLTCIALSILGFHSYQATSPYDLGPKPSWSLFGTKNAPKQPPPKFYTFETTSAFYPVSQDDVSKKTIEELCAAFPNYLTERIQPVLKMGHGEDPTKRDAQLDTVSACFSPSELLIFSDFDEPLGTPPNTTSDRPQKHAIDIIANLPQAYHDANPDFANYDAMRALRRAGKLTPSNDPTTGKNGWALDKYKFLAEVERAWLMRPNRDWYVFYESDTYVVWDNMFRFLSTLDPDVPLYMGSPSPGRMDEEKKVKTWFANGGPGFVISRGAMEKLRGLGQRKSDPTTGRFLEGPLSLEWLEAIRNDCCGDSVLGWMLWTVGVPLSGMFPMFNVYPTHAVPYTERAWCQPVLTMHKTDPKDMRDLWRWENGRRTLGRPLLFADLYEFRRPGSGSTPATRKNWDNTNYDRLAKAHDVKANDLAACTKACEDDPKCFQYMFRGEQRKSCVLMPFINLGMARKPERNEKNVTLQVPEGAPESTPRWKIEIEQFNFTSGWLPVRIGKWREEHECEESDWLWPSIERYF